MLAVFVVLALPMTSITVAAELDDLLNHASALRQQGKLSLAIGVLESAVKLAGATCPARLRGELGATYLQARRVAEAARELEQAYAEATVPAERAVFANDLGNLRMAQRRPADAAALYGEAFAQGAPLPAIRASAGLNLARLAPPAEKPARLRALFTEIDALGDSETQARFFLNLGIQARGLAPAATELAFRSLEAARRYAVRMQHHPLAAESLDALAQLYEDRGRREDALALTDQAMAHLHEEPPSELLVNLQWRRGRLLRGGGRDRDALAAYQAAVDHIEAIRQDIPIEYHDGRSSFRDTLEPIYLGLADLLLDSARSLDPRARSQAYARARDTVELIKQTELQDYLGDRCATEAAASQPQAALRRSTALLYPLILPDRLELLLETGDGILSFRVPIGGQALREKAIAFARSIRFEDLDYLVKAKGLYDLLIRPVEGAMAERRIDTLVIVPDGALRLVPFSALHDGERYVIERLALAVTPGRSLTSAALPDVGNRKVLLAGLSSPGPVVDKLSQTLFDELTGEERRTDVRSADRREKLDLPSVALEIKALEGQVRGQSLLDGQFTKERFRQEVSSGQYRIVHVASHAVFSRRAETSFILAFDDIVTADDLQSMLQSGNASANPIEMLTLSACQTAEGDDRAPLGIAGAALKARARTALGSLWRVSDDGTKALMIEFYGQLGRGKPKTEALRAAQLALLQRQEFRHPYFWAPFVLVGNWQ